MRYQTTVYSAMMTYNTATRELQGNWTVAKMKKQAAYAKAQRENERADALTRSATERARELAILDAMFTKWENEANYDAEVAESLLAKFQAGLGDINGIDAKTALAMYDGLNSVLAGLQATARVNAPYSVTAKRSCTIRRKRPPTSLRWMSAATTMASSGDRVDYESEFYSDFAAYLLAEGSSRRGTNQPRRIATPCRPLRNHAIFGPPFEST